MKMAVSISTTTSRGTMLGWPKHWPRDIPIESEPNPALNFVVLAGDSAYALGVISCGDLLNFLISILRSEPRPITNVSI
jgi:hypothetical protein